MKKVPGRQIFPWAIMESMALPEEVDLNFQISGEGAKHFPLIISED